MPRKTHVYFITSDPKWEQAIRGKVRVKIGEGYSAEKRRRGLQTGNPRLLYNFREPIPFPSKESAQRFETWAHNYAEARGKRLYLPGGREFFDLKPRVIDGIRNEKHKFGALASDPILFRIMKWLMPESLDWILGFFLFLLLLPLQPFFWFCDFMGLIGSALEERWGYTPAGWILMYLFDKPKRIKNRKASVRRGHDIQFVGNNEKRSP